MCRALLIPSHRVLEVPVALSASKKMMDKWEKTKRELFGGVNSQNSERMLSGVIWSN